MEDLENDVETETRRGAGAQDAGGHVRKAIGVILLASLAFLIWQLRHVLVVAFAAIVVATLLVGSGNVVRRFIPLGHRWAVALGGVTISVAIALVLWASWPQVSDQTSTLLEQLDGSLNYLREQTGIELPDTIPELMDGAGGLVNEIWQNFRALAGTLLSALSGIILVIVSGAFLASDPRLYRDGLVLLFPPEHHDRARTALNRSGRGLTLWLAGKLISMAIIGLLVGVGAWAIGLPSPLALGLVAALLEFVPFIGPFVGAAPGLLLAFSQGWSSLLWALLLYAAVQQLESNLITPKVLQKAVSIPPALFMLSVLCMGSLFGVVGVILSGPLTVAAFVLVRSIYIENVMGEELHHSRGV